MTDKEIALAFFGFEPDENDDLSALADLARKIDGE